MERSGSDSEQPRSPTVRLLVTGGDELTRDTIAARLRGAGYRCEAAAAVEAAIAEEERNRLLHRIHTLQRTLERSVAGEPPAGDSAAIQRIRSQVGAVARSDAPVLITGERGTGKNLIARAIHLASHELSAREGAFVVVNCAAATARSFERELYGRTEANGDGPATDGCLELASDGTLLLDEVGEVELCQQARLVQAIDEQRYTRSGHERPTNLSARVVATSTRDLGEAVARGSLRADLYHRLRGLHIHLPPLRDHFEDIPALCAHFVGRLNEQLKLSCSGVDADALELLQRYRWPGNVRELQNVLERAMLISGGVSIVADHLPADLRRSAEANLDDCPEDLRSAVRQFEVDHIRRVLAHAGGRRGEAAVRLGINPSTLWRKIGGEH